MSNFKDIAVEYKDSPSLDAFARLRVSNPALTLFDSQQQYNDQPLVWNTKTVGSATSTHVQAEAASFLETTVASGDQVIRQTKAYHRYQPGKSQQILCTGQFSPRQTNLTQRIGYFDSENGIFFELRDNEINVVQRSSVTGSVVEERVSQANWNYDKLDGTGVSRLNIDFEKSQIFTLDLEWLSVGRVRVGVVVDGSIKYCHYFRNANKNPGAYMTTANLPVRYELENTGAIASPALMRQICSAVASEGGLADPLSYPFEGGNGVSVKAVPASGYLPLFSIRPRATFHGLTNRATIFPTQFNTFSDARAVHLKIIFNGTLTGASWSNFDTNNSAVEQDTSATAITGGLTVFEAYVPGGSGGRGGTSSESILSKLPLTLDIDGLNPDTITAAVARVAGAASTNAGFAGGWVEIY